ncbi:MAG: hypothetical protein E7428_09915 [Ruminococcaceae bacterium]|nr:hypothetical protein [Oscillospiraceae bacterium]
MEQRRLLADSFTYLHPQKHTTLVHKATREYWFLHDTAVAWHGESLYVAYYHCRQSEMIGHTLIHERVSHDGGVSFGPETILSAPGDESGLHVPPMLFEIDGELYAYVTRMTGPDICTDIRVMKRAGEIWQEIGILDDPMIVNGTPQKLDEFTLLAPGRVADRPGEKPERAAILKIDANDPAKTELIPMPLPDGEKHPRCPESTLFHLGDRWVLLVRNDAGPFWMYESMDGLHYTGPFEVDLPMEASKPFGGNLTDGGSYLVYNAPNPPERRSKLVLLLANPGEKEFTQKAILFWSDDRVAHRRNWHYPCVAEHDGKLYVSLTAGFKEEEGRDAILLTVDLK